jgi:peptidyl-prolyl cis-trans isomerase A (cyclophilin A)
MRNWMTGLFLALAVIGCSGETEVVKVDDAKPAVIKPTPQPVVDEDTPPAPEALPEGHNPALLNPSLTNETAPETYQVKFETTNGSFTVQIIRAWAPLGADRFYNLVKIGYYDGLCFFRAIDNFMVQYGIHADPRVSALWREAKIDDDPVTQKNTKGRITFATAGPNTRTTQVFINYNDRNVMLDGQGFAPFGEVMEGMDVVDSLYKGYGEGAPRGRGPDQGLMQKMGNVYLNKQFPKLDHILSARVVSE